MTILKVSEDGRLILPDEMRLSLGLGSGGEIDARIEGQSVRLSAPPGSSGGMGGGVDIGRWMGKGRSFQSRDAVDRFIEDLRGEWD